jgi:hypothetical protein
VRRADCRMGTDVGDTNTGAVGTDATARFLGKAGDKAGDWS